MARGRRSSAARASLRARGWRGRGGAPRSSRDPDSSRELVDDDAEMSSSSSEEGSEEQGSEPSSPTLMDLISRRRMLKVSKKRKSEEGSEENEADGLMDEEAGFHLVNGDQNAFEFEDYGKSDSSLAVKKHKLVGFDSADLDISRKGRLGQLGDLKAKPILSGSFKIGECIRRAASQLTGPVPVAKCSGEAVERSGAKADDMEFDISGIDDLPHMPMEIRRPKMSSAEEFSSPDEMLSQLCLAARDPLKGYSFISMIVSFFSEYRNSSVCSFVEEQEHVERTVSRRGRKKKATAQPSSKPTSSEMLTPDHLSDSYWSDLLIQESAENDESANGLKRRGGSHMRGQRKKRRSLDEPAPLLPSGDELNIAKPQVGAVGAKPKPELTAKRPIIGLGGKYVNESSPTELVLCFNKPDSLPSRTDLIRIFGRYGPLKEAETEVMRKANSAKVVFRRLADAEMAFRSAGKYSIFGPALLSYKLRKYSPSTSSACSDARSQDAEGAPSGAGSQGTEEAPLDKAGEDAKGAPPDATLQIAKDAPLNTRLLDTNHAPADAMPQCPQDVSEALISQDANDAPQDVMRRGADSTCAEAMLQNAEYEPGASALQNDEHKFAESELQDAKDIAVEAMLQDMDEVEHVAPTVHDTEEDDALVNSMLLEEHDASAEYMLHDESGESAEAAQEHAIESPAKAMPRDAEDGSALVTQDAEIAHEEARLQHVGETIAHAETMLQGTKEDASVTCALEIVHDTPASRTLQNENGTPAESLLQEKNDAPAEATQQHAEDVYAATVPLDAKDTPDEATPQHIEDTPAEATPQHADNTLLEGMPQKSGEVNAEGMLQGRIYAPTDATPQSNLKEVASAGGALQEANADESAEAMPQNTQDANVETMVQDTKYSPEGAILHEIDGNVVHAKATLRNAEEHETVEASLWETEDALEEATPQNSEHLFTEAMLLDTEEVVPAEKRLEDTVEVDTPADNILLEKNNSPADVVSQYENDAPADAMLQDKNYGPVAAIVQDADAPREGTHVEDAPIMTMPLSIEKSTSEDMVQDIEEEVAPVAKLLDTEENSPGVVKVQGMLEVSPGEAVPQPQDIEEKKKASAEAMLQDLEDMAPAEATPPPPQDREEVALAEATPLPEDINEKDSVEATLLPKAVNDEGFAEAMTLDAEEEDTLAGATPQQAIDEDASVEAIVRDRKEVAPTQCMLQEVKDASTDAMPQEVKDASTDAMPQDMEDAPAETTSHEVEDMPAATTSHEAEDTPAETTSYEAGDIPAEDIQKAIVEPVQQQTEDTLVESTQHGAKAASIDDLLQDGPEMTPQDVEEASAEVMVQEPEDMLADCSLQDSAEAIAQDVENAVGGSTTQGAEGGSSYNTRYGIKDESADATPRDTECAPTEMIPCEAEDAPLDGTHEAIADSVECMRQNTEENHAEGAPQAAEDAPVNSIQHDSTEAETQAVEYASAEVMMQDPHEMPAQETFPDLAEAIPQELGKVPGGSTLQGEEGQSSYDTQEDVKGTSTLPPHAEDVPTEVTLHEMEDAPVEGKPEATDDPLEAMLQVEGDTPAELIQKNAQDAPADGASQGAAEATPQDMEDASAEVMLQDQEEMLAEGTLQDYAEFMPQDIGNTPAGSTLQDAEGANPSSTQQNAKPAPSETKRLGANDAANLEGANLDNEVVAQYPEYSLAEGTLQDSAESLLQDVANVPAGSMLQDAECGNSYDIQGAESAPSEIKPQGAKDAANLEGGNPENQADADSGLVLETVQVEAIG